MSFVTSVKKLEYKQLLDDFKGLEMVLEIGGGSTRSRSENSLRNRQWIWRKTGCGMNIEVARGHYLRACFSFELGPWHHLSPDIRIAAATGHRHLYNKSKVAMNRI
jgi:hypothetical protein